MSSIPRYMKGDQGRFDFRVPDGIGRWAYPDWTDPGLKVEFYDAENTLRFTATTSSDPALVQGDDFDQDNNPDGGAFVAVEGIDLTDFALGLVEAKVYAEVDAVEVKPYPSVLTAFEVVADLAAGPLYTTVERVKAEIPGAWPDEVTDEMVTTAISDASRKIDAYLSTGYETPFADIAADPSTPSVLESTCRNIAACQCLEWMGKLNASPDFDVKQKILEGLLQMVIRQGQTPLVRLPGYRGPLAVYRGDLVRGDDQVQEDILD